MRGYARVALGDESELITKGTTPSTLGLRFESQGIPFVRAQNIVNGSVSIDEDPLFISDETHETLKRSQIRSGDVLISIAGTIGRAGIVPDGVTAMNCNQAVAIIRPTPRVDRRFLLHWLSSSSAISQISKSKVTATISNLSLGQISSLKIPLPPLDEQRRIAAILDKADALRRMRKRALKLLDGLTRDLVTEAIKVDNAQAQKIETFADVKGGKRLPKGHDYIESPSARRYLRVTDIQNNVTHVESLKSISEATHAQIRRYVIAADDVVISIAGTIGSTMHIEDALAGVNLTENAAKIVIRKKNQVDAAYLNLALQLPQVQNQIRASTGQVTIGKLALFRIEQLEIPLLSIDRQRHLRKAIASIKGTFSTARTHAESLDCAFNSLQHRAFSGQL